MVKLFYLGVLLTLVKLASSQKGCADRIETYFCAALKRQNGCETEKIRRVQCRKTCGSCDDNPASTTTTAAPQLFPTQVNGDCVDKAAPCRALERRGFCADHAAVRKSCPRTCKVCKQGAGRPTSQPAGWNSWGTYGDCSVTCGTGYRTRYRSCLGKRCRGKSSSTARCSLKACQPQGKWSRWGEYGPCSAECGGGTQRRTRNCISGSLCAGDETSTRECNKKPCEKRGKWSRWGSNSECSKSCGGGIKTKTRECVGGTLCRGKSTKTKRCNRRACPVTGVWGPWTQVGVCSVTCGEGTMSFSRKCSRGPCVGDRVKKEDCNKGKCPSAWGPWGKPSTCSKSCGTGYTMRTRKCNGDDCEGPARKTEKCNTVACSSKTWTPCTKTCGTGTRFKFDSLTCTNANNPKCLKTFKECNTNRCPKMEACPANSYRYESDYSCCTSHSITQRVLLGKKAGIEQWPWMVLVQGKTGVVCGGTLIHEQWVMTAAHCVSGAGNSLPKDLSVYAGIQSLSEKSAETKHEVESITPHPEYKNLVNDIALIKLKLPIRRTLRTTPVSLPKGESTPIDSKCWATGWGLTDPHPIVEKPSDPLMQVDLQILDTGVCRKSYRDDPEIGPYVMGKDNLLCAGSLSKRNDVCKGDSGGPLMCQRCSSCDWYVAGVTSFGPIGTCGKIGYPGMYSKVAVFESWITRVIPSLKSSSRESCPYKYGP